MGLEAIIGENNIKLGSRKWILNQITNRQDLKQSNFLNESTVFLSINNEYLGYFSVSSKLRIGISEIFVKLKQKFRLFVLSGDNDSERKTLTEVIGNDIDIEFNQLPDDKIHYIESLKSKGQTVLMIGDGLNDIGALQAANIGVAVTEDTANFTPGSDGIILAENLSRLPDFIKLALYARKTIIVSFIISFLYNIVGISFAIMGELSPVFAAILMPLSSVSIIALTVTRIKFYALRHNL